MCHVCEVNFFMGYWFGGFAQILPRIRIFSNQKILNHIFINIFLRQSD
jgi:hypothetical protein